VILVDTSAWAEYFRATGSPAAAVVRRLLDDRLDDLAMCEPIAMEILAGAGSDTAYSRLERLVNGLPSLTVDDAVDFRSAAKIYRAARRTGKTIRSITDCLIAAVAIRHDATLVHRDGDFEVIGQVTTLAARRADSQ
jgi:hypothetical protein